MKNTWVEKGNTTKPGNPLWNEYVNKETGESTLEEHVPKTVMTSKGCNCYFERIDNNGNIQCKKCGIGQRIITGIHGLKKGKVITLR